MGGGYYDRDDDTSYAPATSSASASAGVSSTVVSNTSSSMVGKTSSLNPGLDPKRWKTDKLVATAGDPIVFALDVTGSMGEWTKIIYDKMPMFYGQIMMQKYLEDPAISFCAIGDARTDNAPLQVSEFGQGREIDQLISKMWLEGNGGGNEHESYELSAYFYYHHSAFTNARLPFFFVTGDEGYWDPTTPNDIERTIGYKPSENQDGKTTWKNLMTKYNVFHIKKQYYSSSETAINKQWCDTLGPERVLHITNPKACVDVMLGAICLTSGARTLDEYVKDMQVREQTKERIAEVTAALLKYSELLKSGKIVPVKANNEVINVKKDKDFTEIREIASKLLALNLETDEDKEYSKGLQAMSTNKADQIPSDFKCPITGQLFFDPVIAFDQHTYERVAIQAWMQISNKSPLTDQILENQDLIPNIVLKKLVSDFYKNNQ